MKTKTLKGGSRGLFVGMQIMLIDHFVPGITAACSVLYKLILSYISYIISRNIARIAFCLCPFTGARAE